MGRHTNPAPRIAETDPEVAAASSDDDGFKAAYPPLVQICGAPRRPAAAQGLGRPRLGPDQADGPARSPKQARRGPIAGAGAQHGTRRVGSAAVGATTSLAGTAAAVHGTVGAIIRYVQGMSLDRFRGSEAVAGPLPVPGALWGVFDPAAHHNHRSSGLGTV